MNQHFSSQKVLIVEDEVMIRLDLEDTLGRLGFSVESRGDLASARAALDAHVFQLAILDLGFDGGGDATALGREVLSLGTALIFCSGSRGRPDGFDSVPFIEKPYRDEDVVKAIEAALSVRLHSDA